MAVRRVSELVKIGMVASLNYAGGRRYARSGT
jgi:hypothetical protein